MIILKRREASVPDRLAPGEVVARVEHATVQLGSTRALVAADLEVRAGEVVALVGPNGAGKSTMLGVLVGDRRPDSGTVELCGRPVASWMPVESARRRAVLPQQSSVTFPFTVIDVVRMGRAPWIGTPAEADDDEVVAAALDRVEVSHLANRAVPSLSGGEQARVALARVLAQQAQLLALDEPTAALDLRHQELVLGLARERAGAGDAVVTVLHDLGLAAAYADRVVMLTRGTVVAAGPPASVLRPERLSEVYRHDVEVVAHPITGALLVLPKRSSVSCDPIHEPTRTTTEDNP